MASGAECQPQRAAGSREAGTGAAGAIGDRTTETTRRQLRTQVGRSRIRLAKRKLRRMFDDCTMYMLDYYRTLQHGNNLGQTGIGTTAFEISDNVFHEEEV